jgi:hypothetical protein
MDRNKFLDILLGDSQIPMRTRRLAALILLFAADLIFCIPFKGWGNILGFIPWYTTLKLAPDFITGLFALVFLIPLYWRRVLYGNLSVFGVLTMVLTLFLTASYIKRLLTGGAGDPVNLCLSIRYFVFFAVLLVSWVGLRLFAGLGFCALFVLAIINVTSVNNVLGLWGFVLVTASFLGIVLQASFHDFGDFFKELVSAYKKPMKKVRTDMKQSVKEGASIIGEKLGD